MNDKRKLAIVFDIDGTLFDTLPGIEEALSDTYLAYGLGEFDRSTIKQYLGPPIKDSLMHIKGLSEGIAAEATEHYRRVYVDKYVNMSKPYMGTYETLKELQKQGCSLSIATLKTRKQVDRLLEISDWKDVIFDHIETAITDGSLTKADMLKRIKATYDGEYSVIMVGDTEGDRKASMGADVDFIAAVYGYGYEKTKEYPFRTIKCIKDIMEELLPKSF